LGIVAVGFGDLRNCAATSNTWTRNIWPNCAKLCAFLTAYCPLPDAVSTIAPDKTGIALRRASCDAACRAGINLQEIGSCPPHLGQN
jgi:hypothetical protein